MAMGMLGPLASGMGGTNGVNGLEKAGEQLDTATLAATTDAAARGGGGGAGGIGGATGVMSSFTRPTGSFNAPGPPKLPSGWAPGAGGAPEVATSAHPSGTGGSGGLYGAPPPHMARDDRGREGSAEGRTMQLTVGPRTGRED